MKRKIFSKLLMVALVIAAVGSFVSCKDYDDDINNLQKQIDAKAAISELTALQSTLDSKIAAAQSAAQAAQATADAAATKTALAEAKAALETAIADAKKAGTDAGTQAGNAITAANKAQETADGAAAAAKKADEDAKAALADALKTIAETYETKADAAAKAAEAKEAINAVKEALAAVKQTADAAFTKAEAEKLQEQVNNLKADLEAAIDEKIDEKIKEVNNAVASVDAIWSAITSIEFVVDQYGVINNSDALNFQFGKQLDNVFGNGKELHSYEATDKPETYKAGDDIKAENIYFVRVSPVNADLAAADLKVINSLGEDLSEFVDIKAEAYKELLTRATETGLWKVTVTLKDGVDREKLQKATNAKLSRDKKRTISSAVYAIAAGNSQEADDTRLAVTTYDLKALTNEYTPATDLDFTVNDVAIANIHNRWDGAQVIAEDGSMEKDSLYWELAWNEAQAEKYEYAVPDVKAKFIKYDATAKAYINNYIKDAGDIRVAQPMLQVQPEEQIVIKFDIADYPFVDRFYVQFEKDNAVESAPSEFESWKSYNATGLSEMKKASERLILTVPSDASEGDIIGFRVWAVNYDGTLVDPDGKAFYVQVGFVPNAEESDILSGTFTARQAALNNPGAKNVIDNKANSVIIPFNFSAKYPSIYKNTPVATVGLVNTVAIDPSKEQNFRWITAAGSNVNIYYLKSDELDAKGNPQVAATVGEIKYIALNIVNPEEIIDDATVETDPLRIIDADKHNKVVGYLSFLVKKGDIKPNPITSNMDNKIAWKTGQNGTFYPKYTSGTWTALFASPGDDDVIDLTEYATGWDAYNDLDTYKWTVSKIGFDATKEPDFTQPELDLGPQQLDPTATADAETDGTAGDVAAAWNLNVTPTMVKYGKQVKITISDYAGVAGLSREDLDNDPTPGKPHVYQTLTLSFKDVVESQDYKWSVKYDFANVGADAAAIVEKDATLYAKYSDATITLYNAWTDAADADASGKITADEVAVKDYPGAVAISLNAIYATSTNTAVATFWNGNAFQWNHYTGFAQEEYPAKSGIMINCIYVKSENGAHNEYITPAAGFLTWGTFSPTTAFTFTQTGTTPLLQTINQTLYIKVVDAFGRTEEFNIPFELVP